MCVSIHFRDLLGAQAPHTWICQKWEWFSVLHNAAPYEAINDVMEVNNALTSIKILKNYICDVLNGAGKKVKQWWGQTRLGWNGAIDQSVYGVHLSQNLL